MLAILQDPFLNILIFLTNILGGNLGWAIIALTILFRVVLLPLNWKSLRSQRKMQQLQPHLSELKTKHGNDKAALSQAQMALYKEHGVSPFGGCLPLLLQIPLLLGIYQAMSFMVRVKQVEDINSHLYAGWLHLDKLPEVHFYGLDLSASPTGLALLLPILAGVTQFIISWMSMPPKAKQSADKPASLEQSIASTQRQMVYFFPVMTFLLAWQFPVGLSLYWTVGNLFSIIQQFFVNRALPHPIQAIEAVAEDIEQSIGIETAEQITTKKKKSKRKKK